MEQQTQQIKSTSDNMRRVEHGTDFTDVTTTKAQSDDYASAVFIDCNFEGMRLVCANLRDSTFINCNMRDTDLTLVNAPNTTFRDTDLEGADLSQAILCGASLERTKFTPANIKGADLRGATLPEGIIVADFTLSRAEPLTALLSANTLQINNETADLNVWDAMIDEHPNADYRNRVRSLLVMCHALRAKERAPRSVDLEVAA